MTARRAESGFTLLELLVALVVFSLVLFVLHQGFDAATRVFERQRVMLSSQDDLYAADRLLRQIVATADPGNGRDGPVFTGGPHGLSWRGTPPAALDNRPDARATMQVSLDRNGHIVLIWAPYRHVIEPAAAPTLRGCFPAWLGSTASIMPPGNGDRHGMAPAYPSWCVYASFF